MGSCPSALSNWLLESDAVVALLLAPDGTIHARNQAALRLLPPDLSGNFGLSLWDYLPSADSLFRLRLAGSTGPGHRGLLLNIAPPNASPVTLEVALLPCHGAVLLLGTEEHRRDLDFQNETLKLSNDLSVMMRESVRKNRELQQANQTIERLARTDPLTGLANRRTLQESLVREIARAARLTESLSVIMADLDHFKSINDQFGHAAGDQVLQRAAAVFTSQLRPYDLAARYGGEEFLLLLPGASPAGAFAVAERIRKELADTSLPACPASVTLSLGIATFAAGETPDEFVARADAALYRAKANGRNCVEAA